LGVQREGENLRLAKQKIFHVALAFSVAGAYDIQEQNKKDGE